MKLKPEDKSATLTVPQAAKILGVSSATLYEAVRMGQIPVLRIGQRRKLIPRVPFERILREGSIAGAAGGDA